MAEITQLHGSAHDKTQRLLPWYNNGTLDEDEAALVDEHLAECAECRAACAADAELARDIAAMPLDPEHGWAALTGDLDRDHAPATSNVAFLRRRVPVAWMIGGQAAAAVLAVAIFTSVPTRTQDQTYHALASAPVAPAGNAVVVFKPETSEAAMRAALLGAGASVVGGPNASGAYVLQLPTNSRATALKQLGGMPAVLVAQPIGAGLSS
jgi:hypothetical protein